MLSIGFISWVGILFTASSLRADYLDWSYDWTMTPGPVFSSGTGQVTFGPLHDRTSWSASPVGIAVALLDVSGVSSAGPELPDGYHFGYDLTLRLTDNREHQSAELVFHGNLTGTYTSEKSTLTNTFTSPLRQHLPLFGDRFDVVLGPTVYPVPPPWGLQTAVVPIEATLWEADHAPEPPGLVLGAVGTVLLGLMLRNRGTGGSR
jgi:hypothetical protein